ncbi:MAG: T9SS type A sorting domain-containing protein [Flavipsychrobacter sp.]
MSQSQAQNYKWAIGGGSNSSLMYSTDWEQVTHMCTDDNRNVYVTTTMGDDNIQADTFYMAHAFNPTCCGATPTPHIFVASYNANGKIRWAKLFDAQYFSRCYGIKSDGAGNIYMIGYLYGNNKHLGYDTVIASDNLTSFIVKYDTAGNFKWVKFIGPDNVSTRLHTGYQSTIAIDGKGLIHYFSVIKNGVQITPSLSSTSGTYDLTYDSSGNLLSANKMPLDSFAYIQEAVFNKTTNDLFANIISLNDLGNLLYNCITKFDKSDNIIWADSVRSGIVTGIDYDEKNGIYGIGVGQYIPFVISNDSALNLGSTVSAIFKLDTFGNNKWIIQMTGTPSHNTNAFLAMTLTSRGHIAVTGDFAGAANFKADSLKSGSTEGWNPIFVIADSNGKLLKLDQLHGDAFYDRGTCITSDLIGDIYIGGWVGDSIFANGISAYHTNGGETDYFVVKYGYNDGCTLSTEPTPMFAVTGDSTHVPAHINFSYTGSNTPDSVRWEFGDGSFSRTLSPSHTYTDTGTIQVCLTVYGCDSGTYCTYITTLKPTSVNNVQVFPNLEVYPNPIVDNLKIANIDEGTTVQLFDIVGSKVYEIVTSKEELSIDTHNLHRGTYILVLTNKEGQRESLRIVKAE